MSTNYNWISQKCRLLLWQWTLEWSATDVQDISCKILLKRSWNSFFLVKCCIWKHRPIFIFNIAYLPVSVCELLVCLCLFKILCITTCTCDIYGSHNLLSFITLFSQGVFPDANVVPIHKGQNKHDVKSVWPISLLSVISELAARCVHNAVYPQVHDVVYLQTTFM